MTTPSLKLKAILLPGVSYRITSQSGISMGMLDNRAALNLAARGEIEGVCSSSGRLRYLRYLPDSARQPVEDGAEARRDQPLNAITNMGAYRQHLSVGTVWALCQCRGMDNARA